MMQGLKCTVLRIPLYDDVGIGRPPVSPVRAVMGDKTNKVAVAPKPLAIPPRSASVTPMQSLDKEKAERARANIEERHASTSALYATPGTHPGHLPTIGACVRTVAMYTLLFLQ